MSTPDFHDDDARRLWESAEHRWPAEEPEADAMRLASWLDGRLDEAARDDVDGHLAACGDDREAVADARATASSDATPLVTTDVLERARSLVPVEPALVAVERFRMWRRAATVAASLVVCVIGYRVGLESTGGEPVVTDDIVAEMTFGAFDVTDDDLLFTLFDEEGAS